ncbi:hypothetical protein, partial [Klebsiella variicola]|uniref:hypothetical protein n=1 Tax=Klebsiella variicola TaxID=244366 RepID=UPI002730DC75
AWLDWPDASEVDTALRATSSTAAVISLTAVAAWSISLFCCCRPLEAPGNTPQATYTAAPVTSEVRATVNVRVSDGRDFLQTP